jgi:hypothetical protein
MINPNAVALWLMGACFGFAVSDEEGRRFGRGRSDRRNPFRGTSFAHEGNVRTLAAFFLACLAGCDGGYMTDAGELSAIDAGELSAIDAGELSAIDAGESAAIDAGERDRCDERQDMWCALGCIGTYPLWSECPEIHCDCE